VGIEPDVLLPVLPALILAPDLVAAERQVVVSVSERWIEANSGPHAVNRLLSPPQIIQHISQVVPRLDETRFLFDGDAVSLLGGLALALGRQRIGQMEVGIGIHGLMIECAAIRQDGLVVLAHFLVVTTDLEPVLGRALEQYIVIDDLSGLISLVQFSTLEIHPWGAPATDIERPDRLIFDLDPGPGVPWEAVVEAARTVRNSLASVNLKSFVQISGGKGLHVVFPIVPRAEWDEAKAFCKAVAEFIASREPKKYTANMSKQRRERRIFIDYLRNGRGATSVAPYSTRVRPLASVATPLRWEELGAIESPSQYTVKNLNRRLVPARRDPWEGFFDLQQSLPSAI
jgi:DNA ligase D-like protein (predicted polymerase)